MKRVAGVLVLVNILFAEAVPLLDRKLYLDSRDDGLHMDMGEPTRDRTIFTVLSLFCMMVLSLLLGARFSKLKRSIFMKRNIMSILALALYILVLMFIMTSAVLVAGQGLYNHALCFAGTWVCLMFYTSIKGIIYVFLVERIHVVRAPFVNRRKDKIYLGCMTMVLVMYGAVAINSYINNVTAMHDSDGRCHFGIRGIVSVPFTVVNFFTDLVLTGVFFYLLRPAAKPNAMPAASARSEDKSKQETPRNETAVQRNIRTLLRKSIIGSLLIEIPMAANMIQFVITKGEELGMICLTLCLIDVFWDALVIYWLTFGSSAAAERALSRSSEATSKMELTRSPNSIESRQSAQMDGKSPVENVEEQQTAHIGILDFLRDPRKDAQSDPITAAPGRRVVEDV